MRVNNVAREGARGEGGGESFLTFLLCGNDVTTFLNDPFYVEGSPEENSGDIIKVLLPSGTKFTRARARARTSGLLKVNTALKVSARYPSSSIL